jgi:2-keto-4-pentenoate hydratase/2-oxohepta-3-ene-1,7-dioic acid hydratase in catechol pathway
MKIARFIDTDGDERYGSILDNLGKEAELLEGSIFSGCRLSGKKVEVKNLLAPVFPANIIAVGLNYSDHARESGSETPDTPQLFIKATTSLLNPEDPIILPDPAPDEVDYEAELAVIIGRKAKDLGAEEIRDYILGFTCGNDVSARDCQIRLDKQWARGKSFDTFCPLGPWIVTTDELDPADLAIKSVLNGQVRQDSRTSQMVFNPFELASYISRQFTLLPGTVIMTGTPSGVGFASKPPRFLRPEDEIVIEIEGIGSLRNSVRSA